jgi:hypothetical protein
VKEVEGAVLQLVEAQLKLNVEFCWNLQAVRIFRGVSILFCSTSFKAEL